MAEFRAALRQDVTTGHPVPLAVQDYDRRVSLLDASAVAAIERGEFPAEHLDTLRETIRRCTFNVVHPFALDYERIAQRYQQEVRTQKIAESAKEHRAALGTVRAYVTRKIDVPTQERRNAVWPQALREPKRDGSGRIDMDPTQRDVLSRVLDTLLKLDVQRQRDTILRRTTAGDDEPLIAMRELAPRMVREEVFADDAFVKRVTAVLTDRLGLSQALDNDERAARYAGEVLHRAELVLDSVVGVPPEAVPPLVTGTGRVGTRGSMLDAAPAARP